jgi:hypothetical protein
MTHAGEDPSGLTCDLFGERVAGGNFANHFEPSRGRRNITGAHRISIIAETELAAVRSAAMSSASIAPARSSGTVSTGNGLASMRTSRSASATGIRAMIRRAPAFHYPICHALVQKADALDADPALHRLDHVVNRQGANETAVSASISTPVFAVTFIDWTRIWEVSARD